MGCFKTGSNLLLSKQKKKRTVWLNPPVNLVINCFKLFVSFVQTKTHKIYKWNGLMWARFLIKGLRRRGNHKRKTNAWKRLKSNHFTFDSVLVIANSATPRWICHCCFSFVFKLIRNSHACYLEFWSDLLGLKMFLFILQNSVGAALSISCLFAFFPFSRRVVRSSYFPTFFTQNGGHWSKCQREVFRAGYKFVIFWL